MPRIYARTHQEMLCLLFAVLTSLAIGSLSHSTLAINEDYQEAYFNGTGFLKLGSTISVHQHSGLSFRTCEGGRLFLQTYNDDMISLDVTPDGLIFTAIIDKQRYEAKLIAKLLNNMWYSISLLFKLDNLTLTAAGHSQIIANATYNSAILTLPDYNVNNTLIVGEGFKGCIRQGPGILFNNTYNYGAILGKCPTDLRGCGQSNVGSTMRGLSSDTSKNYCHNEPCMMHGKCIPLVDGYECQCSARYSGKNCQIDNGSPCNSNPCRNFGTCKEDEKGDYICICSHPYTGYHCESQLSGRSCKDNPCRNKGICLAFGETDYKCKCAPGWAGRHCEIDINECDPNPCKNGGRCVDGIDTYTCRCESTGYEGKNCEIIIDECVNNPCLNKGHCYGNYGSYLCHCPQGFKGQNCELNLNECISSPCKNGGTCVDDVGSYHCNCLAGFAGEHCERRNNCENRVCPSNSICLDVKGGAQCVCKPGYMGNPPNCSINLCASNPCENGGTCSSNNDGYNCTCPPEWKGSHCHIPVSDWCSVCYNGGTCIETIYGVMCQCPRFWTGSQCKEPVTCRDNLPCRQATSCHDYPGGYYCSCEPGWTGPDCSIDIDECSNDPCRNGGICIDQINNYFCQCLPGFTGKTCQINVDECSSQPCMNGGTCIDSTNGYFCNCTSDYMGEHCEREYDACAINPCTNNGTCTLKPRSKLEYACHCQPGFEGKNCEKDIDDCISVVCPGDRVCVDAVAGYECKCPEGYREPNCTLIVNYCLENPCSNNSTCVDLGELDSFRCDCTPGYTGTICDLDINECELLGNKSCNNGICINTAGSYNCFCRPGLSGDHCEVDVNECLGGPCQHNGTCIDKINSYECRCTLGYGGKDCDINIDECESNPCKNNAVCIDQIAAYTCDCVLGFTGHDCETNINDCESQPCLNYGRCIDGINNYTCDCKNTGFEGDHCETNIDECLSNPCVNQAVCVDDIKTYKCRCFTGYTGQNCEIDINECESSPCQYNGTCLERSNQELYKSNARNLPAIFTQEFSYANASGYECLCVQGLTGQNCEKNINECESNPCIYGKCKDRIGGYTCECDDGFEGDHCEHDIDECMRYQPCQRGNCSDAVADYYCACEPEYGGKNCSVALIGCQGKACQNGGTCWPYLFNETQHRFNCTCPYGFHGDICDHVTTMSLSGSSYVMINTSRDEGYDIQFRFRTTLPNGLLAMGKGTTFYILELVDGKLNLHSSILNRWEGVFIGSGLNNSKWQRVFVAINATHLVLSANDEQTIYPINLNEGSTTSPTTFPTTYIGGTISYLRKLTHGPPFFIGCTEDVIINGEWIYPDMNSDSVLMESIEPRCPREEQCLPNPCKAGGHCTDRWQDFSCKCERPYLGHTCQYNMTAATFGYENIKDGYVTVKVADAARRAMRYIVDISMFIRTREQRGDIFYLGSELSPSDPKYLENTYIAAQLEGGELLVRMQFNGTESYTVDGVKLNDGNNHLIQVIRNLTLVQVKINGTEYFRKTISATGQLNVTVLYLGGLPQVSRYIRQVDRSQMELQVPPNNKVNFKGIIQDVRISNGAETMVVEFFPLKAKDIPPPIQFGNVTLDKEKVLPGEISDPVCKSNPCYHNGTCHVTWNDFWCQCPRGYTGKTCQEMEFCQLQDCPQGSKCQNLDGGYECIANATFDGTSTSFTYVYNQLKKKNIMEFGIDSIEIMYRSNSGGTLMHMAPHGSTDQHFTVSVYKDNVTVAWKLDVLNQDTVSFGKDVADGNWTSIILKLSTNQIVCGYKNTLDETTVHSSTKFNLLAWYDLLSTGAITLGGLASSLWTASGFDKGINGNSVELLEHQLTTSTPPHEMMSGEAFKGCLGEVRIGSMLLHYFTFEQVYGNANFTPSEYLALQSNTSHSIGCQLCFEHECKNNGHCHDELNSYVCDCPSGYTEADCSVDIDECENNNCQNNSTCIDGIANYTCECTRGWQSWQCDKDVNECVPTSPCQHDGVCVNLPGSFKCECPDSFTGELCEQFRLITCKDHPCENGSTCSDVVNHETGDNFTCSCLPGFEGVRCNVAYCNVKNQRCQNGGRCDSFSYQSPQCTCLSGFTGRYCEINIDDCAKDEQGNVPCKNDGACEDGIDNYTCNCTETGYTGPNCSEDIDECALEDYDCGNGKCINLPGSFHCECEPGYCGYNCGMENPCHDDICLNGGTCECNVETNGYVCVCPSGFTGQNCSESEHLLGSQVKDIALIVGPIVAVILAAITVSATLFIIAARKKRATRGTYSPSAQEFSNPRVEMDNVMKPPPEERLI
ncbi:protein crumbs isoform X1 [Cotesia glomerata]|uniref:protein crumbs isoform X1 n=1 Tax=Cotesia glomerata TaxID=32391 RepID=UPI001D02830E|nr:protein crumbs isoform X1 [Cotesia glomerata]XP_044596827.1 protein crumbs isoform X1 [Cotesia glomerata]